MFSGIVQRQSPVLDVAVQNQVMRFTVSVPSSFAEGIALGASVAVDGVCLTVTQLTQVGAVTGLHFDVIPETLERTTLQNLAPGRLVNLERSLRLGDEVGGHLVSGHVKARIPIVHRVQQGDSLMLRFGVNPEDRKYLFPKGYVALDGASLTVTEVGAHDFGVQLIPETISRTTLGAKQVGDLVNWEVDSQTQTIVDTLERLCISR